MTKIKTYIKILASEITNESVLLGEQIGSTGETAIYEFRELKEYFGTLGITGVTAIIDKNDTFNTGNVKIFTGDLPETTDFRFVTDADLLVLERFLIDGNGVLEIHDQNGVKVISLAEDGVTLEQTLLLKDVVDGSSSMDSLVIDPVTGEIKKFKFNNEADGGGVINTITIPNHTFIKNDFITKIDFYWDYADNVNQLPATVMVVEVVDNNTVKASNVGIFDWNKSSLIEGADYYLGAAGEATEIYQEDNTQSLFRALSSEKVYLNIGDMFSEQSVIAIDYSIKLKSFAAVDTSLSVDYTGVDTPIWMDGNQTLLGVNVTFNWIDDTIKTVTLLVSNPELLSGELLYSNLDIFELNLQRTGGLINFHDSTLSPPLKTVKRLYAPNYEDNSVVYFQSNIQVLDFRKSIFNNGTFDIRKCGSFESLIQPEIPWSITEFILTDSVIYETLVLNNLTINGTFSIADNSFIEEIKFNPIADWSLCKKLNIVNSSLMKFVDFSVMVNILTLSGSSIFISGIDSSSSDMDLMLSDLVSVVPDNSESGKVISILGGAAPSAAGLADKVILEGFGIIVNL